MYLLEMISILEKCPPDQKVEFGFGEPHSHRGDYCQLAFEPVKNTTVGEMLECAKNSIGQIFIGYKGGEYKMGKYTDVYLAKYSQCGDPITIPLLGLILGNQESINEFLAQMWGG